MLIWVAGREENPILRAGTFQVIFSGPGPGRLPGQEPMHSPVAGENCMLPLLCPGPHDELPGMTRTWFAVKMFPAFDMIRFAP